MCILVCLCDMKTLSKQNPCYWKALGLKKMDADKYLDLYIILTSEKCFSQEKSYNTFNTDPKEYAIR